MTRLLLAFVCAMVIPQMVSAQYLGVTLDRVTSTVDWQYPKPPADCQVCIVDASPNSSRHATGGGIVVAWRPNRFIGMSSEALFVPKGYAVTQPTLEVNYLSFPQLLRVGKLVNGPVPLSLFLEAGVAPSIRLHCRVRYNSTAEGCFNGAAFGQDWRVRHVDASALAGAGVAVRVFDQLVVIRSRVDYGLRDVGGPEAVPTKHRSLVLSAAWLSPTRGVRE